MKIPVNQYKIERISSKMSQDYGKIKRGDEELYGILLHCMEGNMLKIRRKDPKCNSRRAQEAINICLMKISGYISGVEYDFGRYSNSENEALAKGLLMSFDPFTNDEVRSILNNTFYLESEEDMKNYFEDPVKCLIRVSESIETWTKTLGSDGYFHFIEDQIGHLVNQDDKMDYSIPIQDPQDLEKLALKPGHLRKKVPGN